MSRPSAAPHHHLQLYEDDAFLVDAVGAYIATGLSLGQAAIVLATEPHLRSFESAWTARGIDVAAARSSGKLILRDAAELLSGLMIDGWPDAQLFRSAMEALRKYAAPHPVVRVYGELVDLLWARGLSRAALRVEELWNELAHEHPVALLCAYPLARFVTEEECAAFEEACALHARVLPAEGYPAGDEPAAQLRAIALLQQKARALEAAVARRGTVEGALIQREAQLREQLQRAEEVAEALRVANERKDEFLAMLGHELRNPLAAVQNTLVMAGLDPSRSPHALDIARRQAGQLRRLIDDLLDVARITEGRIQLRREPVVLARAVEAALEGLRPLLEERAHRLSVEAPAEDVYVDADPARLEQILGNLLSNAAKYTAIGGRIAISVEVGRDTAAVRIADSGIGIEPEMKARIFDLFVQGARGLDRSLGGLGIGLNVAQRLTELHGGRIEVRSEGIGLGSEFSVHLPLLDAAPEPLETAPGISIQRSVRILVVEDNADVAEALAQLLDVLGHRVRTVHEGRSAIEAAREEIPELLIIDIGLPDIEGHEVARQVRKLPGAERATLVALTGYGTPADRHRSLEAGFDHHLVKPVDPEAIQAIVAGLERS